MNHRTCVAIAVAAFALGACDQPEILCQTPKGGFLQVRSGFAATYTLKSGSGECAQLKGDVLGLEPFSPAGEGSSQDFSVVRLGIRTREMGSLEATAVGHGVADPEASHSLVALGTFVAPNPTDDICRVDSMSPAELTIPEVPPTSCGGEGGAAGGGNAGGAGGCAPDPGIPATDIRLEWSNVRVLVRGDAPGTQMAADLRYTKDGCTADYGVNAVWPAVSCQATDGEGNPMFEPSGQPILDPTWCSPDAAPEKGRPLGSALNRAFPIVCDPVLALCVLSKPFPAFK